VQGSLIATPYMVNSPRLAGRDLAVYTTNTLIHQVCMSVVAIASLGIAAKLLAARYWPSGLGPVVLSLALVIAAITCREYVRQLSFAWLNMRAALLLDSCVTTIQLAGLLFLGSQGQLSARRAYYVSGAACALAVAGWFYLQRRQFTASARGAMADFRRNWGLGKWNLAGGMANLVGIQTYPWILAFFHGNAATGSLAACLGIVLSSNPFILGVVNFLGPKITHAFVDGGAAKVHRIMAKATLLFFAFMIFFSTVMLVFGGMILRMIYGNKYDGLDIVVGVLAF
jgi:O-antigen/teichoic acid export membrane protein